MDKIRIVAAGSGGQAMSIPKMTDEMMKLATASLTTRQEDTVEVVYLGTATYDKEKPFEKQTEHFRSRPDCNVFKLDVSEAAVNNAQQPPSKNEIWKTLERAHVVLVSGGNTLYAIQRWKLLGIDGMLRKLAERGDSGPVFCGGSAGAITWFDWGHSDSMDPTTFLQVDPNLTEEQKKDWKYIR